MWVCGYYIGSLQRNHGQANAIYAQLNLTIKHTYIFAYTDTSLLDYKKNDHDFVKFKMQGVCQDVSFESFYHKKEVYFISIFLFESKQRRTHAQREYSAQLAYFKINSLNSLSSHESRRAAGLPLKFLFLFL